MAQIEKQIIITYRWWNQDLETIDPDHAEALEESATQRISEMRAEGYTSGELHDNIFMNDSDPEDGIDYQGWWEVTTTTI